MGRVNSISCTLANRVSVLPRSFKVGDKINVPCCQSIVGPGAVPYKQGTNDKNTSVLGQCPAKLKFSGTFGNFMCQMGQKHNISSLHTAVSTKKITQSLNYSHWGSGTV